jgi:hypothetical protein
MNKTEKCYSLVFEERPDYLYARVEAPTISRDIAAAYLDEVASECASREYRRLLIDRDIPEMLEDTAIYFITNVFLEKTRGVRMAVVDRHQENANSMRYAIQVARDAGFPNRSFDDLREAEKWLLDETVDDGSGMTLKERSERAADLIAHLERMRPHVEHDPKAFKKWQDELKAAERLLRGDRGPKDTSDRKGN